MSKARIYLGSLVASTRHELGQGLTEYALILLFVAIAVIAAVTVLGVTLDSAYYDRLASELLSG